LTSRFRLLYNRLTSVTGRELAGRLADIGGTGRIVPTQNSLTGFDGANHARTAPVGGHGRAGLGRWWPAVGILLFMNAAVSRVHPDAAGAPPAVGSTLKVGTLVLERCGTGTAWCGALVRALDPADPARESLSIHFEYYAHVLAGKSLGTLVATEGGPGFPATDSRDEYLGLYRPLLARRDLVIMDNRGTGQSGAINCAALQSAPTITIENLGACGRQLGPKAALYSTALAADDLAAILDALGSGPVDLYGDSYGTYFAQVFALRHPAKLRSVVLDGAYALDGPDYAWYPTYAPAMRDKFNIACSRDPACAKLPGTSLEHIAPALARLRTHPFKAQAHDADGRLRSFTADASHLATVMFGSAPAYASVREVDAAARAYVAGDSAPLLRLMAETIAGVDSRDDTQSPVKFSAGLAAAVTCHDPPQIFNMSLAPEQRLTDRDRVIARRKLVAPDTYAPFTIDEYRGMPLDYTFIDECVLWPVAPPAYPAGHVVPATAKYPDIPALIISADLDNMTTRADGAAATAHFPHGRQVIVANGFHVNALPHARSGCGADIVRNFVTTLQTADTRCTQTVPTVHLLAQFARHVADLAPAHPLAGNAATTEQLRAVTAALLSAGDVIARVETNTNGEGVGLRGGTFSIKAQRDRDLLTLRGVRWTEDLAVSGQLSHPNQSGRVDGALTLSGADEFDGSLIVSWAEGAAQARAQIHGKLGSALVAAEMVAP
jgi:pimeloyl-ACP methyl ester carboxylesterase